MYSINESILKFLTGNPVIFKDICLIYSPTIDEIAKEGNDSFLKYIGLLTGTINTKEDLFKNLTDFQYLLFIGLKNLSINNLITKAFYFFTKEKITITNSGIIFGDIKEKRILKESDFLEFQSYIELACALIDSKEEMIEFLDTDDDRTKMLKKQLLEGRKKRKKIKNNSDKNSNLNISDLVSSLAIGTGQSILEIKKLTYYAFQDQLKRMSWQEEFNINTKASLAGAKIQKEKLQYWIRPMALH